MYFLATSPTYATQKLKNNNNKIIGIDPSVFSFTCKRDLFPTYCLRFVAKVYYMFVVNASVAINSKLIDEL